ncbi:hypothetical protein ACHAQH_005915 [Verticillium albo-atrum]
MSNDKGPGNIRLGHVGAIGNVTREDVAATTVSLLSRDDTEGWMDLFEGATPIDEAVATVVEKGVNAFDGESLEDIVNLAD